MGREATLELRVRERERAMPERGAQDFHSRPSGEVVERRSKRLGISQVTFVSFVDRSLELSPLEV
jgi:hypothetical protein